MNKRKHLKRHLMLIKFNFSFTVFVVFIIMSYAGYVINSSSVFAKNNIISSIRYLNYKSISAQAKVNQAQVKNEASTSIPVLVYHGFASKSKPESEYSIDLKKFEDQMISLKKSGYRTVTLEDLKRFNNENASLPEKSFLLTFDDGRQDMYYNADPLLRALNYNAVIFDITEKNDAGSNYYLSKDELKRMTKSKRWDVEAHAYKGHGDIEIDANGKKGHFFSNKQWLKDQNRAETTDEYTARIKDELTHVKNDLESTLNTPVTTFAYPYGDYGQESLNFPEAKQLLPNIVKEYFPLSFYQYASGAFSYNYAGERNALIKRIIVDSKWSGENLLSELAKGHSKQIPYSSNTFDQSQGWVSSWGNLNFDNRIMKIESGKDSAGSSVFLDGSKSWKNYSFSSTVNWEKGSDLSVLSNYLDDNNYLSFNLTQSSVRLVLKNMGEQKILKEIKRELDVPKDNLSLGIRSIDGKTSLFIGDKLVLEYENSEYKDLYGGVGFKIWDKQINNASMQIKSIKIVKDSDQNVVVVDPTKIKSLPYKINSFNQDLGWTKTWGTLRYNQEAMILESTGDGTGASSYLQGSENWQEYSYQTKLDWSKGSNVILMARYLDEKNYVSFNISDQYLRIEQRVDDQTEILKEIKNELNMPKYGLDVKIDVVGNKIVCYFQNSPIFDFIGINSKFNKGAIGFKIWDQAPANAKIIINEVLVDPL